jgi:uncharacterized protein YjiS (DUF1127 family)
MTRPAAHTRPAAVLLEALNWLADRDAAYRARRRLEDMPPERLADMGIGGPSMRPASRPRPGRRHAGPPALPRATG